VTAYHHPKNATIFHNLLVCFSKSPKKLYKELDKMFVHAKWIKEILTHAMDIKPSTCLNRPQTFSPQSMFFSSLR